MKKKLLAILLLLITVFSGAALGASCGGGGDDGGGGGRVVVTYYLDEGANSQSAVILNGRFDLVKLPTKAGYVFGGLYDAPSGGTKIVDETGHSLFAIERSITLYARWIPLTYTIVFDANGGELIGASGEETYAFGESVLSFPTAEKEGFDFNGWCFANTSTQCADKMGAPMEGYEVFSDKYPITDGKVTLVAIFNVKQFKLVLDYNDGSYQTQTVYVAYGDTVNVANLPKMDNGSSEVIGWSTSQMGNVPFDGTVAEDMTIYAVWRDYKTFLLYEDAENLQNGKKERVYRDASFTLPTPTKGGYNFDGWYTSTYFSGNPVTSVSYGTVKSEYYAKWVFATYTLWFHSNGGGEFADMKYTMEDTVSLPTPEKEKYTFVGWCKKSDLSDTPIKTLEKGSYGNISLYAKYKGEDRTLTLDAGDGTLNETTVTVEYGAYNKIPVPTYEGYAFEGWYADSDCTVKVADHNGKCLNQWLYEDVSVTYYAKFTQKYYITAEKNIAEAAGDLWLNEYYREGESVTLTVAVNDGYSFDGWYVNGRLISKNTEFTFEMGAENMHFVLEFHANEYTLTLSIGEDAFCKGKTVKVTYNEKATLPIAYKQGWDFEGWYFADRKMTDENGELYDVWTISRDVTLVANYVQQPVGKETFFIRTMQDWKFVLQNPSASFILFNDVDLTGYYDWSSSVFTVESFSGKFDGQGYTIKANISPLFKTIGNMAIVKNLVLETEIGGTNGDPLGCLAGYNNGKLENITVKGSIDLTGVSTYGTHIGGIVGGNAGTIVNCTNYATVKAYPKEGDGVVGGIAAWNSGNITGCKNFGDIDGSYRVGGIVGHIDSSGSVEIKDCFNKAKINGTKMVGGIVGNVHRGTVTIDGCYTSATVTGTANVGKYVGSGTATLKNFPTIAVSTVEDFLALKHNIAGEKFALIKDIDLSEAEWTPFALLATLDGRGHTVKGISLNSNIENLGVFTVISGELKNINFENLTVVYTGGAGKNIGGVCGHLTGKMEGVQVISGSVSSSVYTQVGGLVGVMDGAEASMKNCANYANVTAATSKDSGAVAGVLAWMRGGKIENCDNYGEVTGQWKVSGIIGAQHNTGAVILTGCDNYGKLTGTDNTGGMVGETSNNSSNVIDNCISAGEIVGSGTSVGKYVGQGTVTYRNLKPIEISSLADFAKMQNAPAEEHFFLTVDIDMTDVEWIPFAFGGTLDGQDHVIKNLALFSADTHVGLFTIVTGAVKNLKFEAVSLEAVSMNNSRVGTVAGELSGHVENVTVLSGTISTKVSDAGGIVGFTNKGATIKNCVNYANMSNEATSSSGSFGGIVGAERGSSTIENCVNHGAMTGTYAVGGIAGHVDGSTVYKNCANYGALTGTSQVGGIIGRRGGGTPVIDGCISAGRLEGGSSIGKYIGSGTHTLQNVPQITVKTVEDLFLARYNVAQESYLLEADLDLSETGWIRFDFVATFDGQEHKITGLKDTGLFGIVTGTIKNLTLEVNMELSAVSGSSLGGLANVLRGGTLDHVAVKGSIVCTTSTSYDCGGIIGVIEGKSTLTYCENYVDITLTNDTTYSKGGLVGAVSSASGTAVTLENCVNYGDISAHNAAGVVYYLGANTTVKDCANYGMITGRSVTGGICGSANTAGSVIDGCINEGELVWTTGSVGKFCAGGKAVTYKNLHEVEISKAAELKYMIGAVVGEKYTITADIDMSELAWQPFAFAAHLDGGEHTITGFTYQPDVALKGNVDAGFFTNISGTVKNLKFAEVSVVTMTGSECPNVGALCGTLNGTVENVHILSGSVTAQTADIGGLIGQFASGTVKNCTNYATVDNSDTTSTSSDVGGVIGYATCATFSNLKNYGDVVGFTRVGGVVGLVKFSGTFTLTGLENHGKVTGGTDVGGVLARIDTATIVLKDVVSVGAVKGTSSVGKYVGTGTPTYSNLSVVQIESADQLYLLQYAPAAEKFVLTADVDMAGLEWNMATFAGTLDGQDHTIKNLVLNSEEANVGFFAILSGTVKNLKFEAVSIEGTNGSNPSIGTVAAKSTGTIENVTVLSGTLKGGASGLGGIVGRPTGGSITGCINYASLTNQATSGNGSLGGIASTVNATAITDCKNYGTITGNAYVGGILGYVNTAMTVKACENYGAISGVSGVGGIGGYGNAKITVDSCVSKGTFTGTSNVGKYVGGGSAEYIFITVEIKTAEDFNNIRYNMANEPFKLMSDIDMSDIEWVPCAFAGRLDGNDKTVSNMSIETSAGNLGMFTAVTGTIKDINFKNLSVVSTAYTAVTVGGIVPTLASTGVLENITILSGTIESDLGDIGGFVGIMSAGTIKGCVNRANVIGKDASQATGGIAGDFTGGTVTDCTNYGTITDEQKYTGGIFGYANATGFSGLVNYGKVVGNQWTGGVIGHFTRFGSYDYKSAIVNYGEVEGVDYVGGIVGYWLNKGAWHGNNPTMNLANFTNEGKVTGTGSYVGGIIGGLHIENTDSGDNATVYMTNFVNTGDVTGVRYVGGLLGHGTADNGASKLSDSSSNADIVAESYVGGLAGGLSGIRLENSTNEGSTVTATSYYLSGTTYYAYLGGYVGYGYILKGLTNTVAINYEKNGIFVGGIAGHVNNATENCINNAEINASKASYVGGIAGRASCWGSYSHLSLTNTGNVTGGSYVGGVFGEVLDSGASHGYTPTLTMTKLINEGNIIGDSYVAGTIGRIYVENTDSGDNGLVKMGNFKNTGDVTAEGNYVGGLIGYGYCDNGASIIFDSSSSANVTGAAIIGGIAGQLSNIQISNCDNAGSSIVATSHYLNGTTYYAYLGGYVGLGYSVSGCTNAVSIEYTDKGIYVGGIAGYNNGAIVNCTNSGDITAENSSYVGGLVGYGTATGGWTHSGSVNTGDVKGTDYVGGAFGRIYNVAQWHGNNSVQTLTKLTNEGTVSGGTYVGGIVGHIYVENTDSGDVFTLTMTELKNTGDITGKTRVGGLIGYGYCDGNASALVGSSSSGDIVGESYVGGVAGQLNHVVVRDNDNTGSTVTATGYALENGTQHNVYLGGYVGWGYSISGCTNAVPLTYSGDGSFIGGIMGYCTGGASACTNSAAITATTSSYVAGIIGYACAGGGWTYSSLENTGDVTGVDYVGGILGRIYNVVQWHGSNPTCTISLSKNSGTVTGNMYVAGIVGHIRVENTDSGDVSTMKMTECTNTGNVTGLDYVAGLIGHGVTDNGGSSVSGCTISGTITGESNVGTIAAYTSDITIGTNTDTATVVTGDSSS